MNPLKQTGVTCPVQIQVQKGCEFCGGSGFIKNVTDNS